MIVATTVVVVVVVVANSRMKERKEGRKKGGVSCIMYTSTSTILVQQHTVATLCIFRIILFYAVYYNIVYRILVATSSYFNYYSALTAPHGDAVLHFMIELL